jgi:hypothetical protein
MPTLDGQTITSGPVHMFEQGDWLADIATNNGARIPDGKRVELVVENVTLSGAIIRGGISGDVGRYLVSGRPEWDKPLPSRARNAYRSTASVLMKNVLADILQDVLGPSWQTVVVMPPASRLGEHYERPGTNGDVTITGRELLALLKLSWYVRNDGVTVFAARESGTVNPKGTPLVSYRNDAIGLRAVMTEDPAAFVPGLTFENEVIGEVVYSIRPEDITTYLWPRKTSNAFADAIKTTLWRMFPKLFFQGVYEYTIAGTASSGRHDLRSVGSRWLPDVTLASFWTGAAGHRVSLPVGTRVGVSFMNSDPSRPVMVCVEPITPTETSWNHAPIDSQFVATNSIAMTASTEAIVNAASVKLGGALAPVVRYGDTVAIVGGGPAAGIIGFTPAAPPFDTPSRVKA